MKKKMFVIVGGVVLLIVLLSLLLLGVRIRNKYRYDSFQRSASYDDYSPSFASDASFNSEVASASPSSVVARTQRVSSAPGEPPATRNTSDRLVIKTGSMSVVVDDVRAAASSIEAMAIAGGGYVVSSSVYGEKADEKGAVTIRVPAEKLTTMIEGVHGIARDVKSQAVTGDDVTEEFVDLESALENLRVTEERYRAILVRSGTIEDVLSVERELTRIRGEINRLEGRTRYLRESAALSSLTVSLATDAAALPVLEENQWRPIVVAKNALRDLVAVLKGLSYMVIWIVVFAVIWAPIGLFGRFLYRRMRRHRNSH